MLMSTYLIGITLKSLGILVASPSPVPEVGEMCLWDGWVYRSQREVEGFTVYPV